MGATETDEGDRQAIPRSVRHKRILDEAAEQPDASFADIAAEVPSATADLVERVLEEYGDPAEDDTGPASDGGDQTDDDTEGPTEGAGETADAAEDGDGASDEPAVSEKQRRTLRAIYEHPEMTQAEIGDVLGVSAPTVSNRVNDIEGFSWADRVAFAADVLGEDLESSPDTESETMQSTDVDLQATVERLSERVATLEERVDGHGDGETAPLVDDPELAHKVLHACLESEVISTDEELAIVASVLDC